MKKMRDARTGKRTPQDRHSALWQLYKMQAVMFKAALNDSPMVNEKGFTISPVADQVAAVRAWKELELLRRLILGKPGSIQAAAPKAKPGCGKRAITEMPQDIDVEKVA